MAPLGLGWSPVSAPAAGHDFGLWDMLGFFRSGLNSTLISNTIIWDLYARL